MLKEYIMLLSAALIVVGWFTNSYLNRRHEIFKKRLDYRLSMLESYIEAGVDIANIKKDEISLKLKKAQINFLLYGTKEEIDLINDFIHRAENKDYKNSSEFKNESTKLMILVRDNLRSELGLEKIES